MGKTGRSVFTQKESRELSICVHLMTLPNADWTNSTWNMNLFVFIKKNHIGNYNHNQDFGHNEVLKPKSTIEKC